VSKYSFQGCMNSMDIKLIDRILALFCVFLSGVIFYLILILMPVLFWIGIFMIIIQIAKKYQKTKNDAGNRTERLEAASRFMHRNHALKPRTEWIFLGLGFSFLKVINVTVKLAKDFI